MEDKKIIINIGRQIGSGGRVIARQLAEQFNCKFYDKELLNLAAKESGFCEKFFEQNDEHKGFLRSLFHIHGSLFGESPYYKNEFSQESLYQFQSDAIRRAAEESSCVRGTYCRLCASGYEKYGEHLYFRKYRSTVAARLQTTWL